VGGKSYHTNGKLGILKLITTRSGVSHCGLAIYIKKHSKAKKELWKFKYLTMQKYNLQKNPLKENKILQDIITLYLISSFNTSQKPRYHLSKILV
jgi:hypothetical protein